jgi:hypothetical protein
VGIQWGRGLAGTQSDAPWAGVQGTAGHWYFTGCQVLAVLRPGGPWWSVSDEACCLEYLVSQSLRTAARPAVGYLIQEDAKSVLIPARSPILQRSRRVPSHRSSCTVHARNPLKLGVPTAST